MSKNGLFFPKKMGKNFPKKEKKLKKSKVKLLILHLFYNEIDHPQEIQEILMKKRKYFMVGT